MKPALNQQAARTTNGTQNWTDASITSDQTGEIFVGTEALANATITAAGKLFVGATDLTNNIAFGMGTIDATAAGSAFSHSVGSSTKCLIRSASGGSETVAAAISAVLSNGITITQSASDGSAYLFNGLSLAGTDHVMKVSSGLLSAGATSIAITHGDSAAPETIIIFGAPISGGTDSAGVPQRSIIGFWDGTNSVGVGMENSVTASPIVLAARINTDLGHYLQAGVDTATLSISAVGATTFTLNLSGSLGVNIFFTCISIRHTNGIWAAKCGTFTSPTSAGIATLISGMAVQPQVSIKIMTRLTSTALASNSDAAGSLSIGISCNNAGTTQQMACAMTEKNGVTTTVAKCYTANNKALVSLDNTGAVHLAATTSSWNSDGESLNWGTVDGGTSFEGIYLGFGIAHPASSVGFRKSLSGIGTRVGARQLQA